MRAGSAATRPGSGRPGPPAAVVQVQAQTGGSAPGRRATPAPASATGLGRRSVTALQRQAAIEGWKRLIREGKLHCMVNCPLGAIDECSTCGR